MRDGVYVPSPWIWPGQWLLWSIEYSGRVQCLIITVKRNGSFHPGLLKPCITLSLASLRCHAGIPMWRKKRRRYKKRGEEKRGRGRRKRRGEGGREESCSAHPPEAPDTVKQRDEPPLCALFKFLILRIVRDNNNSYFLDFGAVYQAFIVNWNKTYYNQLSL